jgi:hypothetical protein
MIDRTIETEPDRDHPLPEPGAIVYWPISVEADLIVGAVCQGEPRSDLWRVDGRNGSLGHESFDIVSSTRAWVLRLTE